MTVTTAPRTTRINLFLVAAAIQVGCGVGFIFDVINEWDEGLVHFDLELFTIFALWAGAWLMIAESYRLRRRNRVVEQQLDAATGSFQEVMEERFSDWGLTPSERDVAILSIKGVPNAEIAAMRQTREGTIKAQNAAVYRKAGVSGRAELLSLFLDELVEGIDAQQRKAS
jgi:DNA-binding CsgD family transcriptional regulator